ncbi:MAG: hypothetical protein EA362_01855 [Saprospirales bacterium]|nr:MAG: hypothetical protein EA362_01855 [Saprospirales bacterium]
MNNFFSKMVIVLVLNPLSRLPFSVIYVISDLLFFLVYYLIRYRKKVVLNNLRNSFPEKSEKEINKIAREFYKHFCDLILESIKLPGLTDAEAKKRMVIEGQEIFQELYDRNRNIIPMSGHYNNWEWAASMIPTFINYRCFGIFKPLKNKTFNDYITHTRSRFGMGMVSKKEFYREIVPVIGEKPKAIFFLSDQLPQNPYKTYWTEFLNQETGFPYGAGIYAVKYNYPVVYGKIFKEKRGFYRLKIELINDNPANSSPEELLKKYSDLLESQILDNPQYWLWTHKRWKRSKPTDYESRFEK